MSWSGLQWHRSCHSNPDHDKFSSLSNTTVVAIFPNVCLWQRIVYAQTWPLYIDPENLYWGTFVCQYAGLCCCIVWPLFLFDCFVKIWAICKNFLGKWSTAPPARKLPVRLCITGKSTWHDFGLVSNSYLSEHISLQLSIFHMTCSTKNLAFDDWHWSLLNSPAVVYEIEG